MVLAAAAGHVLCPPPEAGLAAAGHGLGPLPEAEEVDMAGAEVALAYAGRRDLHGVGQVEQPLALRQTVLHLQVGQT